MYPYLNEVHIMKNWYIRFPTEKDKNIRQGLTGLDKWPNGSMSMGQRKVEPILCVEPLIK